MKLPCCVVEDLYPLYQEKMVSEETQLLIESHLEECSQCRKGLDGERSISLAESVLSQEGLSEQKEDNLESLPLKRLHKDLKRKRRSVIIVTVFITLLVAISLLGLLTAPVYMTYSQNPISITKIDDYFRVEANAPDISFEVTEVQSLDSQGESLHIAAWTTKWDQIKGQTSLQTEKIETENKNIDFIYYDNNDGSASVLLHQSISETDEGTVTLPRLVLSYYASIAFLILIVLGLLYLALRKNDKWRPRLATLITLPLSYLLAHLCIKGIWPQSYNAIRDLSAILLSTLVIESAILWARHKITTKNK